MNKLSSVLLIIGVLLNTNTALAGSVNSADADKYPYEITVTVSGYSRQQTIENFELTVSRLKAEGYRAPGESGISGGCCLPFRIHSHVTIPNEPPLTNDELRRLREKLK